MLRNILIKELYLSSNNSIKVSLLDATKLKGKGNLGQSVYCNDNTIKKVVRGDFVLSQPSLNTVSIIVNKSSFIYQSSIQKTCSWLKYHQRIIQNQNGRY